MNIAPEHLTRIQGYGYTRTEAQFLCLVATHSGYFTRRQFLRFAQVKKGGAVCRFIDKLLQLRRGRGTLYGRKTFVYQLHSWLIYEQIEKNNLCNRRWLSNDLIRTRLMILDFVLDHLEPHYLETEAHKLSFFHHQLHLPLGLLPGRIYKGINSNSPARQYFVDRFPIHIPGGTASSPGPLIPTFVYCDLGGPGLLRYIRHLRNYENLLHRLTAFNFVYAAASDSKFKRAAKLFASRFGDHARVDGESLIRYFEVRQRWESHNTSSLARADRELLREGDRRFQGQSLEEMYLQWAANRLSRSEISDRLEEQRTQGSKLFSTYVLPHAYDIFERISAEHSIPVSRHRASAIPSTTARPEARAGKRQEASSV
jgi:hypothetical protein